MNTPILTKCPFCGAQIQHFIGHVSGCYAFYCTQSKKLIVLYDNLHEKIINSEIEPEVKKHLHNYIQNLDDFEIPLSLEKFSEIKSLYFSS